MPSIAVKITKDFLPVPMADVASPTLSQATALPPAHIVASIAIPTIGSICAVPEHPLHPHPEAQKMATPGIDVDHYPNAEEEETNIKAKKVRKKHFQY